MKTQTEIQNQSASEKKQTFGLGSGLCVTIESIKKGGGKSFIGRKKGKEVRIGVFGSEPNKFTLKKAKVEWNKIQEWANTKNQPVNRYKKSKRTKEKDSRTLGNTVESFLSHKAMRVKATTLREYRMKLNNQVLTQIDRDTPLKNLEWSNGGREIVMHVIDKVREGEKHDLANRCHSLLDQTFRYAINQGYMPRGENPAEKLKDQQIHHRPKHHCTITWEEVPQLLTDINLNKPNAQVQTVLATKLLLMTFLRAGALVRLKWDWIDRKNELITIAGTTPGLKRYKGLADHIPHHIPITEEIGRLLDFAAEFSFGKQYVFQPLMDGRTIYPHISPSAPNDFLKRLGYKNKLRAHGWRSVALTYGQDVLGVSNEVIQRQMSHLPHKKGVRGKYDNSLLLPERKLFLKDWCSALIEKGLQI